MEKESRFFKIPEKSEEKPEEMSASKPEEITISEVEIEKAKAELGKERGEQKEKEEFLDKMQRDEQEMTKGILRKVSEASPRLRKAIMVLATAGILLSAGKAFAGGEQWQRTQWGWQNTARQVERMMPQLSQARESQKAEAVRYQYQLKEKVRFDAYQEYKNRFEAIQKAYEQQKFNIMIGRVEGATDYFGKQKAYQELEQWKYNEEMRARQDWSFKVWAAEEEYRQKTQQIQQWR